MEKPIKNGEQVIMIGAGELAEIAYEYFTYDSPYEIVGFSAERDYIVTDMLYDLPVVPLDQLHEIYPPNKYKAFVAVPYTDLNRLRTRFYKDAKSKGYEFVSYVSSRAFVWRNVTIGENCFIFENNVLQHHVNVGNNVIMWTGNNIGHRVVVKDNCFFTSQVAIAGRAEIGESCFLGINSTIIDETKVAKDCYIAAGAVVVKDTKEGRIYRGNPAKPSPVDVYRYFKIKQETAVEQ